MNINNTNDLYANVSFGGGGSKKPQGGDRKPYNMQGGNAVSGWLDADGQFIFANDSKNTSSFYTQKYMKSVSLSDRKILGTTR